MINLLILNKNIIMKNTIKLVFTLLLLINVYSCETEETLEQETQSETLERRGNGDGIEVLNNPAAIEIENRMQWVSYMTAQVILRDSGARQEFKDEVEDSGALNAFPIRNLLENDGRNLSFKREFRIEFFYHFNNTYGENSEDPCDGTGRPEGRPKPTGVLGGMSLDVIYQMYILSLLNDNCFEFYLPNGYAPLAPLGSSGFIVPKSTAHPMTNAISNEGFSHTSACYVSSITVDDNTPGVIIVVRPFTDGIGCTYYDFLIDFEDFLD